MRRAKLEAQKKRATIRREKNTDNIKEIQALNHKDHEASLDRWY